MKKTTKNECAKLKRKNEKLLELIKAEMEKQIPENPNYGHVGDLKYTKKLLLEILAFQRDAFDELEIEKELLDKPLRSEMNEKKDISQQINAFEVLHSQVCNGGFQQWLINGYGELAEITICTLEAIGTENALKVADMVKKVIAEVEINSDDEDFIYDSEFCEYLDGLDNAFYQISDALQEEFKAYLGK